MVYTQDQLLKMSSHDINQAVWAKITNGSSDQQVNINSDFLRISCFRPCNTWNDVMPLAEKYRIALLWGSSCASLGDVNTFGGSYEAHVSMKRAICEVFLMMDVEQ